MTITITDDELLAQLARTTEPVEVLDAAGQVVLRVQRVSDGKLPPGAKPPLTDEQIAERRKSTGGRPLADIVRDLEAKHGS